MTIPSFVGNGMGDGSNGPITPALPGGLLVDDILVLIIETAATEDITVADPNGGTWTEFTNSPQSVGASGNGSTLTVFWSRYNGTQGDPTTDDSGNHQVGRISAFRGCETVGVPFDVTGGNTTVNNTDVTISGLTTTVVDCMIVLCSTLPDNETVYTGTWTNGDLTNVTQRYNIGTNAGNDGQITLVTGGKATAGLFGDTTNTTDLTSRKANMAIALKEPAAGFAHSQGCIIG